MYSKDASDRLTYENLNISDHQFGLVVEKIEQRFRLTSSGPPILGPDQIVWQAAVEGHPLDFGWDVWSGFYITAVNRSADPVLRRIGDYLSQLPL